jgi:hypothetical protein
MVGTISLYDAAGERQHTTYVAARPESGRATFPERRQREVEQVKRLYPQAHYQGLADGAPENWTFLEPLSETQVLDFGVGKKQDELGRNGNISKFEVVN